MSGEKTEEKPVIAKKTKTKAEKQAEHINRIKRTLTACLLGIAAGVLSYLSGGTPDATGLQDNGLLAFMIMLAAIVIQRHIFVLLRMDTEKLGAKDWLYQGFMTFAFWFVSWTILLSSLTLVAGFSANVTSGPVPVAVAFTDSSTGSPANWSWNFGDGATASTRDPVHVYTTPGKFNVSLTVSNAGGNTTRTVPDFILVNSTGLS